MFYYAWQDFGQNKVQLCCFLFLDVFDRLSGTFASQPVRMKVNSNVPSHHFHPGSLVLVLAVGHPPTQESVMLALMFLLGPPPPP